jgi:glucose/mannose-6-phosphate isomerase
LIDLDDRAAMRAADPGGMLDAVTALPQRCRDGYHIGLQAQGLPSGDGVTSIAVCGMGGSAVPGDALAALAAPRLRLPVSVVRTPELPESCGPHTLVVASSYSGDTAETLDLFEEAVVRGCRIVPVTSGGELSRRANELDLATVVVPDGSPPRAAIGWLMLATLGSLETIGVLPSLAADLDEAVGEIRSVTETNGPEAPLAANRSKALAASIGDRVPVVWGAEGVAAVAAVRWKTQFNENGKAPAFAAVMPELDHNDIEGWAPGRGAGFAVLALRHESEHPDVAARFAPSLEIARASGAMVEEVWASGRSPLAALLTLVQTGDFVATYHAIMRGVDPTPIDAIARLKRALADA